MKCRKIIKNAAIFTVAACISAQVLPPAYASGGTIKIKNTHDYIYLTKKCKTDSWSVGKTVELSGNIDLSKIEFTPIPTFGGNFKGNGYTLSGVNVTEKGSHTGLFRYLQKSAVVENLSVDEKITPDGTKKYIGGICGENSGTISDCSFSGTVTGKSYIGGICGENTESGVIVNSRSSGTVIGKSYTGGICGENLGTVKNCENRASVNTSADDDEKRGITDIDADLNNLRSTENIDTATDTGGICGYSKGKIYSCKNYGNIGYKSVGYNTGGICGQTEPYILLEYTGDVLDDIKRTISEVRQIVNNGIDVSDTRAATSLDNINSSVTDITDCIDVLSENITDYADSIAKSANDLSVRADKALADAQPSFDNLTDGIGTMTEGLTEMKNAADYLESAVDEIASEWDDARADEDFDDAAEDAKTYLRRSVRQLASASELLSRSIISLESGARVLKNGIKDLRAALKNSNDADKNLQNLRAELEEIAEALTDAENSIEDIANILRDLKDRGYLKNITSEFILNLKQLASSFGDAADAVSEIGDGILIMLEDFDISSVGTALLMLSRAFNNLDAALDAIFDAADMLDISLSFKAARENGENALNSLRAGIDALASGADNMADAAKILSTAFKNLRADGVFSLPLASDTLSGGLDGIISCTGDIQKEFSNLNALLSEKKSRLHDDLDDIGGKLQALSDILSGAYEDKINTDLDDIYLDISDTDSPKDTRGKIENSRNFGEIYGDINVGGTVGSMAVEYDFDPEGDTEKSGSKSINFTYKTKNVIRRCTNNGKISAKKNRAGGICGKMDLGSIISCDNYGSVSSSDGDYVGGICGDSATVIRNSAAKCTLSGNDYVGGIAGNADKITDCRALIRFTDHGEFCGSIAGSADTSELKNNRFVAGDIGGIDDINYSKIAEECDISEFVRFVKSNLGKDVIFTLRFIADDKEIAAINFNYGDRITDEQIPSVPEKRGYYGKWSEYDFENAEYDADLTAEYHRNMDIIASSEKRSDGKSVALLTGAFDDNAAISAKQGDIPENAVDVRKIAIKGCHTKKYRVRYLPASQKNTELLIDSGNGAKKISTVKYGSYLEFETNSPSFTLYERHKSNTFALIAAIALIGISGAAWFVFNRRKKIIQKKPLSD